MSTQQLTPRRGAWHIASLVRNVASILLSGKVPSRRALGAVARLHGWRLQRKWPPLSLLGDAPLELGIEDALHFQFSRRREFHVLVVGAFDGVQNDPVGRFVLDRACAGTFVEPQPAAFERLRMNFAGCPGVNFRNAAIDKVSGARDLFYVRPGSKDLPAWTQQLASFDRAHIERHEHLAPGVSARIERMSVPTISFESLIGGESLNSIDVLQIDVEGLDAFLLGCFPFHLVKPAVINYEIVHMSPEERRATQFRLSDLGYFLCDAGAAPDQVAILI